MKPAIRTPYFEIGTKNYIYGDKVLQYAKAADAAAEKYDIDVLFITPAVEIRRVAENTKRLIVLAPYMDILRPGRGMADILPEALKAAGAQGVVINHCEKPMSHMGYVMDCIREIKAIDPGILVEQAAGITNGQQVYDFIMAGSEAAGAASGIMNAKDPIAMIDEMIAATRRAANDLKKAAKGAK